jgi:hypothetical protein
MLSFRTSPDLTAEAGVIVDDSDANATLRRSYRGRHARGPSTDHQHIEALL